MPIADIKLATVEDCRAAWLYCASLQAALDAGAPLSPDEQREVLSIAQSALLIAASHRTAQGALGAAEAVAAEAPDWLKLLQETKR